MRSWVKTGDSRHHDFGLSFGAFVRIGEAIDMYRDGITLLFTGRFFGHELPFKFSTTTSHNLYIVADVRTILVNTKTVNAE